MIRLFIRALVLPVLLLAAPSTGATTPSSAPEAAYRFLTSDRRAGGILYTATAGVLNGLHLPLSYHDSAAYWAEHVCAGIDCTVEDVYNPHDHTLTPRPSPAGDLQTERVNTHNGANIYDAATWQIAVMLGQVVNGLVPAAGGDAYQLASNQNLLLQAGYNGDSRHRPAGENRALSAGSIFVYNQRVITEPSRAYSFRMLPRTWLATDPFAGTPHGRLISASGLPPTDPAYRTGVISWTDWKPITGENGWAFLIGPLQAARLHYLSGKEDGFVPYRDPAIQNGLAILPTFAAMQAKLGGIYYAPAGTIANQGTEPVDPFFVAVENTLSLYAGLRILSDTLKTTLDLDPALTPDDRQRINAALHLCRTMIHSGVLEDGRSTDGLLAFFRHHAWQGGIFVQGGMADKPGVGRRWQPVLSPKAVDVNTWGIAALGPETIDSWFGFGAAIGAWRQVKRWGGYGQGATLWGVGFSDLDGNGLQNDGATYRQGVLSAEWTGGALVMVRTMLDHYGKVLPSSPHHQTARDIIAELAKDEASMLAAMDRMRLDTYAAAGFPGTPESFNRLFALPTQPYLYASRRYLIPFGWYANPIPSTCATAWMLMVANRFNPFEPVTPNSNRGKQRR